MEQAARRIAFPKPGDANWTAETLAGVAARSELMVVHVFRSEAVCPFLADDDHGGYVHVPRPVDGAKVRERGPDDEYSQATMFWKSMTEVEQDHIVDAYTFELGKCDVQAVVETMLPRLALVDGELARRIGFGLGLAVDTNDDPHDDIPPSPSLAMITEDEYAIDGRVVHVLADDGATSAASAHSRTRSLRPAARRT